MKFQFSISKAFSLWIIATIVFVSISCVDATNETNATRAHDAPAANAIDINSASAKELETIPGIGDTLAKRIVEFREKNGRFRRPEHLLLVPGISEKRFRQFRPLIRTE
jgi:competence ComEA-like helix-hairpin-helix protein